MVASVARSVVGPSKIWQKVQGVTRRNSIDGLNVSMSGDAVCSASTITFVTLTSVLSLSGPDGHCG